MNKIIKQGGPRDMDRSHESWHMNIWCIGLWIRRLYSKLFRFSPGGQLNFLRDYFKFGLVLQEMSFKDIINLELW